MDAHVQACKKNGVRRVLRRVALAILAPGTVMHAQEEQRVVAGVVQDSAGNPVGQVEVRTGPRERRYADEAGRFRLELDRVSSVAVDLRRLGFMPVKLTLPPGGDTAVVVIMQPVAQELSVARVSAERVIRNLEARGFYERMTDREKGINTGEFVTVEEIEVRRPIRITQMLDGRNGVRIRRGPKGSQDWKVLGPNGCLPTLYIDGMRLHHLTDQIMEDSIDMILTPGSVAGIEIYSRGAKAPPQYQMLNGTCGVVLFWTR